VDSNSVIISLEKACYTYQGENGTVEAIKDIDIAITDGEFICLLGPSGCGKSTLLKLLAGFIAPTSGSVLMEGAPITGPDRHRGVVFQSPTLFPWYNVRQNVGFGLKMRKFSKNEIHEITNKYLEQVKLLEFASHKPYELSGGMQQRVSVARALANDPRIVLMDEPLGALDALTRENMRLMIRNIWHKNKKTFFLITHDVDEALMLGTRVLVMSSRPGQLIREIPVEFTYKITGSNADRTRFSREYLEVREELLNLISAEDAGYAI